MAIDSRDKRFSVMGLAQPAPSIMAGPSGAVGAQGRAQLLYLYAGIALVAPPVVVIPISTTVTPQYRQTDIRTLAQRLDRGVKTKTVAYEFKGRTFYNE